MHVYSCCFAQQTYCFFDVLVAIAVVVAKAPRVTWSKQRLFVFQHLKTFSCPENVVRKLKMIPGFLLTKSTIAEL